MHRRDVSRIQGWNVEHLVIGMEGGEVPRDVGAEVLHHPAAHRINFLLGIVLARDQQHFFTMY